MSFLKGSRQVMVGEWSVGLPTNYNTTNEEHLEFGKVQLETYARYANGGWAFWSWKLETDMPTFDFRASVARGWLPFNNVDKMLQLGALPAVSVDCI